MPKQKPSNEFEPITFGEETMFESLLGFLNRITIKKAIALILVSIAAAIAAWAYHQFTLCAQ